MPDCINQLTVLVQDCTKNSLKDIFYDTKSYCLFTIPPQKTEKVQMSEEDITEEIQNKCDLVYNKVANILGEFLHKFPIY